MAYQIVVKFLKSVKIVIIYKTIPDDTVTEKANGQVLICQL